MDQFLTVKPLANQQTLIGVPATLQALALLVWLRLVLLNAAEFHSPTKLVGREARPSRIIVSGKNPE
jgi:hypothetical protein